MLLCACSSADNGSGQVADGSAGIDASTSLTGGDGPASSGAGTGDTAGEGDSTTDGTDTAGSSAGDDGGDDGGDGSSSSGGIKLDVPLGGDGDGDGDGDGEFAGIPTTCPESLISNSTVGCEFFAVDLDQLDSLDDGEYAITVSNVQQTGSAAVTLEAKMGGMWTAVGNATVAAQDLHTFVPANNNLDGTGVAVGGAYRITSDVPVVAYQFNPLDTTASAASSDASMLYPVHAWDHLNEVVGWYPSSGHNVYFTVVASVDGTVVEVTPSISTLAGGTVPAGAAGTPFTVNLDEGDVLEVAARAGGSTLSGTTVTSQPDKPIAVFSGAECVDVVDRFCDHLEIQLAGLRLWGNDHVAIRMPPRVPATPEISVFQIYASEDGTTVTFDADGAVTGLPTGPQTLDRGDTLELQVGGSADQPGDFAVSADKPIAVMNYMAGSALADRIGDPAMVQIPATEQYLDRYVVLVPETWDSDFLGLTRPVGSQITLDGNQIAGTQFETVGNGWEVARIQVPDGVHVLEGSMPFGVVVSGYTEVDSYAYTGGLGTRVINPTPAG